MPGRTSLEVQSETKDRVNAVKGPLTADQLINLALDHLPRQEIIRLYEEWQEKAVAALAANPRLNDRFHPPPRKRKR